MPAKPNTKPAPSPAPAFVDPATTPDIYALRVSGDCMAPAIRNGDHVLCDKCAPVEAGELAVFYYRPDRIPEGERQANLKRIVLLPSPSISFPYHNHPDSTVSPVMIVESDNPQDRYAVDCDALLGIHRCLGLVPAHVKLVAG